MAAQVRDEVGDVAVLVNNAAFSPTKNYVSGELSDDFEIFFCQHSGSLLGEVGAARREGTAPTHVFALHNLLPLGHSV